MILKYIPSALSAMNKSTVIFYLFLAAGIVFLAGGFYQASSFHSKFPEVSTFGKTTIYIINLAPGLIFIGLAVASKSVKK
jgi:hypothetical protein